jgi:hypothetical protein
MTTRAAPAAGVMPAACRPSPPNRRAPLAPAGTAPRALSLTRIPSAFANARLKTWRVLRKLRCCPWKAGQLAKAIHVLQPRDARMTGHTRTGPGAGGGRHR